jgi:hypothetical protein
LASESIILGSQADIRSPAGSIELMAAKGNIEMSDLSLIQSAVGGIRLQALGSISLGGIDAGPANVSLIATTGSILDGGATYTDIVANATPGGRYRYW